MRRWVGRVAALAAGALLAGAARAADAPTPAQAWWAGYLANGQLVKLPDGRSMHLYCEGHGAPTLRARRGAGNAVAEIPGVRPMPRTRPALLRSIAHTRSNV